MRRNFAQAIKSAKVDPKKEYSKLFELFYGKMTEMESRWLI